MSFVSQPQSSLEDRLCRFASSVTLAIAIDELGTVRAVTSLAAERTGRTADEIVGRPWLDLIAPEHRDRASRMLADSRSREDGMARGTDIALETSSGSIKPVDWMTWRVNGETILRGTERTIGTSELMTGVSSNRRELLSTEPQHAGSFRTLLSNFPLFVVFLDGDGSLTFCSESLLEATGWTRDEAIGHDFFSRFLPEDVRDELRTTFSNSLRAGKFASSSNRTILTRDGRSLNIRWGNSPIVDDDGVVTGVCSIGKDITDELRVVRALRESEASLRSSFEQSAVGMCQATQAGELLQVNDRLARIVGYEREDLIGRNLVDLVSRSHIDAIRNHLRSLVSGYADTFSIEIPLVGRLGGEVWAELTATLLKINSSTPDRVFAVLEDISERIDADRRRHESAELYKSMFETHAAVKILIDPTTGRIVDANAAACRFYGYEHNVLTAMRIQDINILSEPVLRDRIEQVLATEGGCRFEFVHRLASGELREVEALTSAIHRGGKPYLLSVINDVTERMRAERQLARERDRTRRQNEILQQIAEGSPLERVMERVTELIADEIQGAGVAILLMDSDHQSLRHGAAHGLPDELIRALDGLGVAEGVGACVTAAALGRAVVSADIATDTLWNGARELVLSHGFHSCWSSPVLSSSGEVLGTLSVYRQKPQTPDPHDLPVVDAATALLRVAIERARHLAALERRDLERVRLVTAIENAPDAIVITDTDGRFIYHNPATERDTGFSAEELDTGSPALFKSGVHDDAFYSDLWKTILDGHVWKGRIVNRRKDGSLFQEEKTIAPVKDEGGRIVSFVAIGRDVTESIEMERKLRESQKMEAVGQLAGGIAHEFNNLLQSMVGYLDLVAREVADRPDVLADVAEAKSSADKAAHLTRRLLTFSRKQPLDVHAHDLGEIMSSLLTLVRPITPESIRIAFSSPDRPIIADVDRSQIEQLLLNLCLNARDSMPDGGVLTLEVDTVQLPGGSDGDLEIYPGEYALLRVQDSGEGMDEWTRKRAFDPFFTTKGTSRGAPGLGLSTVYGIVRQHGGFIELATEKSRGTIVDVYLRINQQREKAADERHTILFAEDDEVIRRAAARMLASAGYEVLLAADGAEALSLYRANRGVISLLILDVVMPNSGGIDAFHAIHDLDPDLPVMFCTGYSPDSEQLKLVLNGGYQLITKPFDMQTLLDKVRLGLGHSQCSHDRGPGLSQ